MTCTNEYIQDISGCYTSINIEIAETTATTDYVLLIKYANESQKLIEVETDADNVINLPNTDLWHVGTGVVSIQLFEVGGCNPIQFTNCATTYDTFSLNFINIQTDATTTTVPCACD